MSLVYYQLCRATGRFVKKTEDNTTLHKGNVNPRVNTKPRASKSTTTFIGVSLCKRTRRWRAAITINGELTCLGYYIDDRDAAIAYDRQALRIGRPTNILKPFA